MRSNSTPRWRLEEPDGTPSLAPAPREVERLIYFGGLRRRHTSTNAARTKWAVLRPLSAQAARPLSAKRDASCDPSALERRYALRHDPQILAALHAWSVVAASSSDALPQPAYVALQLKLYRALLPAVEPREAEAAARDDFRHDAARRLRVPAAQLPRRPPRARRGMGAWRRRFGARRLAARAPRRRHDRQRPPAAARRRDRGGRRGAAGAREDARRRARSSRKARCRERRRPAAAVAACGPWRLRSDGDARPSPPPRRARGGATRRRRCFSVRQRGGGRSTTWRRGARRRRRRRTRRRRRRRRRRPAAAAALAGARMAAAQTLALRGAAVGPAAIRATMLELAAGRAADRAAAAKQRELPRVSVSLTANDGGGALSVGSGVVCRIRLVARPGSAAPAAVTRPATARAKVAVAPPPPSPRRPASAAPPSPRRPTSAAAAAASVASYRAAAVRPGSATPAPSGGWTHRPGSARLSARPAIAATSRPVSAARTVGAASAGGGVEAASVR